MILPILLLFIEEEFGWALGLFLAAGLSDGIDGWLAKRYLPDDEQPTTPVAPANGSEMERESAQEAQGELHERERAVFVAQADAPPCHECGAIMVRNGACYACANCGATSGCS